MTLELFSKYDRRVHVHDNPSRQTVKWPLPPAPTAPTHGPVPILQSGQVHPSLQAPSSSEAQSHAPSGTHLWFRMRWIVIHSGLMP